MAMLYAKNTTEIFYTKNKNVTGPLVADGTPYSAIDIIELKLLSDLLGLHKRVQLEPVPKSFYAYKPRQYGIGTHSSAARKTLGFTMVNGKSDNGHCTETRHLVINGSSQRMVFKNVIKSANISHANRNIVEFMVEDVKDGFTLIDHEFLSYVLLASFVPTIDDGIEITVMSCLNGKMSNDYL